MKKNKFLNFIVLGLFLICIFELFYKLGDIPNGIHVDEAGSLYDALSISNYGVDRFLYKNPVYLINYGGGQSVMYTYLAVIFMKIFGETLYSFRLVAVVFSLLSYYLFYKMISRYDSKIKSVFVLFLLTIFPFYIMKSRWGLDCYLLNPLFIISLYFFVIAIEKKSNFYYFISGILFGITLYTYALSYLILPLFLIIIFIYLFINKKIKINNMVYFMIPIIILAIPLILFLLVNNDIIKSEIITDFISIPKLWDYRGGEISILNFRFIVYDLYMIFWGDLIDYNTIDNFGTMYFISIILIIVGYYFLIKKLKNNNANLLDVIMVILFFVILGIAFLSYGVNVNKINLIYISFIYFISSFLEWLYNNKCKFLLSIIIVIYCFFYINFINYYFNDFEPDNLIAKDDYFKSLEEVESIYEEKYSSICISTDVAQDYIFNLLTNKVNPHDFNEILIIKNKGSGNYVASYMHYVYDCDVLRDDYIYLVSSGDKIIKDAKINDYNIKNIGNYYILYKE